MYESINRFASQPEFQGPLNELFGTDEWRGGLEIKGEERKRFFFDLYASQLRKHGAKHVVHFDVFEGNRLVYAIFFATTHWKGADVMKQAIWKVVPSGGFAFRGTRSRQLTLGLQPDLTPLRHTLQAHYSGKGWVTIEDVIAFVASDQTDFHSGQLKKPVLVPMEDEKLLEIDPKSRKRRHSFPSKTRLRFR